MKYAQLGREKRISESEEAFVSVCCPVNVFVWSVND